MAGPSEPGTLPGGTEADAAPARPVLQVLTPHATAEEVAALVAVLSGLGGAAAPRRARPGWTDPARGVRSAGAHGHGGWRASSLPR